jgi:hypothetical protein
MSSDAQLKEGMAVHEALLVYTTNMGYEQILGRNHLPWSVQRRQTTTGLRAELAILFWGFALSWSQ